MYTSNQNKMINFFSFSPKSHNERLDALHTSDLTDVLEEERGNRGCEFSPGTRKVISSRQVWEDVSGYVNRVPKIKEVQRRPASCHGGLSGGFNETPSRNNVGKTCLPGPTDV